MTKICTREEFLRSTECEMLDIVKKTFQVTFNVLKSMFRSAQFGYHGNTKGHVIHIS